MERVFYDPILYYKGLAQGGGHNVCASKVEGRIITLEMRYKTGAIVNEEVIECYVSNRFRQRIRDCSALTKISSNCWILEPNCSRLPPGTLKLNRTAILVVNVPDEIEALWVATAER